MIYTTNMIESVNYQLRKVVRNQRRFSIERSALKLIYFAINNIKTKGRGPQPTNTPGWTACINQPAVHYPQQPPTAQHDHQPTLHKPTDRPGPLAPRFVEPLHRFHNTVADAMTAERPSAILVRGDDSAAARFGSG